MKNRKTVLVFILLMIAFVFITGSLSAQIKGIDLKSAITVENDYELHENYGHLVKIYDEDSHRYNFIINYKENVIGLRSCIQDMFELTELNNKDFSRPDTENDYLASYVDGITDYETLDMSIKAGGSEISRMWTLENNMRIGISCSEVGYIIIIYPYTDL
jgi:hypothetical protein